MVVPDALIIRAMARTKHGVWGPKATDEGMNHLASANRCTNLLAAEAITNNKRHASRPVYS